MCSSQSCASGVDGSSEYVFGKEIPCALCLDQSSHLISTLVGPSKSSSSDIDDSSVYTFKKQLLHLGLSFFRRGLLEVFSWVRIVVLPRVSVVVAYMSMSTSRH